MTVEMEASAENASSAAGHLPPGAAAEPPRPRALRRCPASLALLPACSTRVRTVNSSIPNFCAGLWPPRADHALHGERCLQV